MPTTYTWNTALCPRDVLWKVVGSSKSGGQTLGGKEQLAISPNARWKCTMQMYIGTELVLPFRAMIAKLQQRLNYMAVPAFDARNSVGLAGFYRDSVPKTGDGARLTKPNQIMQTTAAIVLGATAFELSADPRFPPLEGQYIAFPDNRLHEISTVTPSGNSVYVVQVWPPVRANYGAGTIMNYDNPCCVMQLATDDTAALNLIGQRSGTPTLEWIEA